MSAKVATLGILRKKLFLNKGYDVITYDHDITNLISSRDSSYFVDMIMGQKLGNSRISLRELFIISILQEFDLKNHFLWGLALVQVQ